MPDRARYIMIGGFLGAGKTTAVARLAQWLTAKGRSVALISNDQSNGLVDTTMLRAKGFAVEEIAGGCFCCRFNSLMEAANRLTESMRPDVFVAEPVGSCTDLVATVSYPLRRIYGNQFEIAPLSVMVDPVRCGRILGLTEGRSFSDKVVYVYRKQLEEADIIVINKADRLDSDARATLEDALRNAFPRADVITCAAKTGEGVDAWFEKILRQPASEQDTMALDYDEYAEGEARLGWLNGTYRVTADKPFNADDWLVEACTKIKNALDGQDLEIAHLKATLLSDNQDAGLAAVSLTGNDDPADLRESLLSEMTAGQLVLNLRAEADPGKLQAAVAGALQRQTEISVTEEHLDHFKPARPEPTHRMTIA